MASLEPEVSNGYLTAKVKLDYVKKISAIAKCNLHGNYISELVI